MIAGGTPLCPAGHLPLKGGDWLSSPLSPNLQSRRKRGAGSAAGLISPLEGEMSGRTEGGVEERRHIRFVERRS